MVALGGERECRLSPVHGSTRTLRKAQRLAELAVDSESPRFPPPEDTVYYGRPLDETSDISFVMNNLAGEAKFIAK